jgi:subtilase family serine protease
MRRSEPSTRGGLAPAILAVVLAVATAGSTNAESASIEATVRVMPLAISLDLSTSQARVGDSVRARATVTNLGSVRVSNVVIELRVDAAAVSVRGALASTIPRIQPGHAASISWNLCATRTGNVLILARATVDGASIESPARLLTISGQRNRGC